MGDFCPRCGNGHNVTVGCHPAHLRLSDVTVKMAVSGCKVVAGGYVARVPLWLAAYIKQLQKEISHVGSHS